MVLLFPNFQRSFGIFLCRPFDWGCKGKRLYFIQPKLFEVFFKLFQSLKSLEELSFFQTEGKDKGRMITAKFYSAFYSRFHVSPTYFLLQ
jgi:hypothetical protein